MSDTPVGFTLQISKSSLRLPGLLSRQPLEQAVPGHPKVGSLTSSRFRFFLSKSKEGGDRRYVPEAISIGAPVSVIRISSGQRRHRVRHFLRSELDFDCPHCVLDLSVEEKLMTGIVALLATTQAMAIWAMETPLWLAISSTLL